MTMKRKARAFSGSPRDRSTDAKYHQRGVEHQAQMHRDHPLLVVLRGTTPSRK